MNNILFLISLLIGSQTDTMINIWFLNHNAGSYKMYAIHFL